MADPAPAVGIDLGTTYSVVAYLDAQGRPNTIPNAEGDLTTPSVVYFDSHAVVVGKEAVKAAEYDPERVARFAKRDMGDQFYEKKILGNEFPPEVIQALILKKLRDDAAMKLGELQKVVITAPAYFNEPRRKAVQDAGALAGLEVLDIINEPTAAAISYGVQQGFLTQRGESEQAETILVYDLGGGTFDVTLMEIEGQEYRTIGTAGDVYLGGVDWDQRIVDFIAESFEEKYGVDPRQDEQALQNLLNEATDAKHALSAREEVNIPFGHDGNRLRLPFSRSQFEELTGDLTDRTLLTVRRVLNEAKKEWSDVTRLLLAGGSTRMPMIQKMLEEESGLEVDRSLSADEAVAHGAAIYAGLLVAGDKSPQKLQVTNVNSHDLGVLGVERDTRMTRRKLLIPRNTALPTAGARSFVTQKQGQANVRVTVVEGGDDAGNNATVIGKCVVSELPPDLPAQSKIKVTFNYAANGRLTIGATLPGTGKHAQMTIERQSGLNDVQIQQWRERILQNDLVREIEPEAEPIEEAEAVEEAMPIPEAAPAFPIVTDSPPTPEAAPAFPFAPDSAPAPEAAPAFPFAPDSAPAPEAAPAFPIVTDSPPAPEAAPAFPIVTDSPPAPEAAPAFPIVTDSPPVAAPAPEAAPPVAAPAPEAAPVFPMAQPAAEPIAEAVPIAEAEPIADVEPDKAAPAPAAEAPAPSNVPDFTNLGKPAPAAAPTPAPAPAPTPTPAPTPAPAPAASDAPDFTNLGNPDQDKPAPTPNNGPDFTNLGKGDDSSSQKTESDDDALNDFFKNLG